MSAKKQSDSERSERVDEFSHWVLDNFARWTSLVVYLFVGVLSTISGAVGHFLWRRQTPQPQRAPFSARELALDLSSSLLAGVLMLWLAVAGAMSPPIAGIAIVAVTLKGWEWLNYARRIVRDRIKKAYPDTEKG